MSRPGGASSRPVRGAGLAGAEGNARQATAPLLYRGRPEREPAVKPGTYH